MTGQRGEENISQREFVGSQMVSVALSLTRFPSVERQLPSMICGLVESRSDFCTELSVGQAYQFGPQWVSKLKWTGRYSSAYRGGQSMETGV